MLNLPLSSILSCPDCHGGIQYNNSNPAKPVLICRSCGRMFFADEEIYNLLPKKIGEWKEIESEFHNAESENYDKLNCVEAPRNRRIHRQFIKWVKNGSSRIKNGLPRITDSVSEIKILEIGGGTGFDAEKIISLNNNIQFILSDLSKGALGIGKKRLEKHKNVFYCLADAENIPFKNGSLDCIYIVAALHHLENPQKFLKEARRCLKSNGSLVIGIEPNKYGHVMWQKMIFGIWNIPKRSDKNFQPQPDKLHSIGDEKTQGFSRGELKKMLAQAEFGSVKIKPVWFFTGFYHTFAQKFKWLDQKWIDYTLMPIDWVIERIPVLNNLCWHWNVITLNTRN